MYTSSLLRLHFYPVQLMETYKLQTWIQNFQQLFCGQGMGSLDNRPERWYQSNHFMPLFKIDSPTDFSPSQGNAQKRKNETTSEADKQKTKRQRATLTDYFQRPSTSNNTDPQDFDKTAQHLASGSPLVGSQNQTSKEGHGKQNISSTSCSEEKTSKEKYEEKRVREFKQHWKDDYPWVEHDSVQDVMF